MNREGALLPHEILIGGDTKPEKVATALGDIEGIHADSGADEGRDTIDEVRAVAHATGTAVRVGGKPASNSDFIDAAYGSFPLMIALIAVTTFILLARAFRSLLLPLKAILLNILSVAAAWGVPRPGLAARLRIRAALGIDATGSITSWTPLMVFAFLSGRLVTSAALILFLSFVALAASPGTDLKMTATGLAAGILLDATIIRALIVPATISLMNRWNWWLPSWPARLLRVDPSPLTARTATGETSA
jgi:RND superfamily putative drug exporter